MATAQAAPPIELFVSLHGAGDRYVRALAALCASIRTHTTARLRWNLVHDHTVCGESLAALASFVCERDELRLIDVNSHPDVASVSRESAVARYSPAVIWRVFAPDLFPDLTKVLVLDADLLFLSDISRLWEVDIEDVTIAAVLRGKPWFAEYHERIRTPPERYFRMCVSLLNLEAMRRDVHFQTSRVDFLRTTLQELNQLLPLGEQTLFNYYFSGSLRPLEATLLPASGKADTADPQVRERLLGMLNSPRPLILDLKGWEHRSPFDYFYWTYLLFTPWRSQAFAELVEHQAAIRTARAEAAVPGAAGISA